MAAAAYSFDIEKINDTVWVFKRAIKNPQDYVDHFEKSIEWTDWYTFGKHGRGHSFGSSKFEEFPTPEEWESQRQIAVKNQEDKVFEKSIDDLFYQVTKLYVEENRFSFDNWVYESWNVAKYEPNQEYEYVMMHHTDYQREYSYNPGSKFAITAVFYLNDNYTGGEVAFRFLDNEDVSIIKEDYVYKPNAGDIVVFMSGHPHYHGVRAVTEGDKYIIRTYWKYDYPGHPLWLRLQEKYGADLWAQMEADRVRSTRSNNNITLINNIPFWIDFEEYYKKEIEMLDP
jgi:hypothetical protein